MLNWIKKLLKLNKEEKHAVTIDTVLEWTIYVEEFGA